MQAFNYIDLWAMFLCLTYTICWFWFLLHFVFLLNYCVFSWVSHGLHGYHILLEWFAGYWLERHMGFPHKCPSFPKYLILSSLLHFWLCPQTIHSEDLSETLLQVPFFLFFSLLKQILLLFSLHLFLFYISLENSLDWKIVTDLKGKQTSTCAIFCKVCSDIQGKTSPPLWIS